MNNIKKLWIIISLMILSQATQAITIHYDTSFNGNGYQEVDLAYGTNLLTGSVTIDHAWKFRSRYFALERMDY